ncbi:hypothetical protein SAMN04244574_00648 [Azotobacter beijerinckii]|uniref:Uncharacterized protein n=1 Tax=Azotobacter beijerinckii TaxID=170623 RepID=A0A1I3ZLF0_9GAMM|nr:hypothetical protein SAMN04244574_00648 [Azotobacter beijerinckii]
MHIYVMHMLTAFRHLYAHMLKESGQAHSLAVTRNNHCLLEKY